jgi:hypothetical protein
MLTYLSNELTQPVAQVKPSVLHQEPRLDPVCRMACQNDMQTCRKGCFEQVTYNHAIAKNDEALCNNLDRKYSCINAVRLNIAVNDKNLSECGIIEDDSIAQNCQSIIIQSEAVANDDLNICLRLPEKDISTCKDIVYQNMAIKSKNSSICEMLTDQRGIDRCKMILSGTDDVQPSKTNGDIIPFEQQCYRDCDNGLSACERQCIDLEAFSKAQEKKDLSLCEEISDDALKEQCSTQTFI